MSLKFISILLLCGLLIPVAAGESYQNQKSVKVYYGEEIVIDDYVFKYDSSEISSGRYFQVLEDREGSDLILGTVDSVYDSEGERLDISEREMSAFLDRVGRDEEGQYLNVTISSAHNIFASADLTDSAPDTVIVSQGGEVEVPLTLENDGLVDQSFNFSAVENSSMTASFNYQGFNITNVAVDSGEEISVTAKIVVPEDTELGNYKVDLLASGETNVSRTINIRVRGKQVEKRREIDLSINEMYHQIQPGETLTIPVEARNRGEASLNNVKLDTEAPDGWELTVNPREVDLQERYEERTIIMELTAPESVQSGDYFLGVAANSEKAETERKELRIHVQKKSGLSYAGIGLMAVSLLGLIAVYRKFGRR